jgi:hypothetical protein
VKVLVVDNFLDNPDEVRRLALKQKYKKRKKNQHFEGMRSCLVKDIDSNLADEICRKIISNYYCINNFEYKADLFFHKTRLKDKEDTQWKNDRVHKDEGIVAGLIYLTPNAPLHTGTQTFVYNKSDDTFYTDIVMSNLYNRLVMYPCNVSHSAMNYFGDDKNSRLVLLFWLYKLKHENFNIG